MRICFMMASLSESKEAAPTRTNRGVSWSNEATGALIDFWEEEHIQLSLNNCKTSKETSEVYKTLLVSTVMK